MLKPKIHEPLAICLILTVLTELALGGTVFNFDPQKSDGQDVQMVLFAISDAESNSQGSLTENGKIQGVSLGKYLRQRYWDLLPNEYEPEKIRVLSGSSPASEESLRQALAGAFASEQTLPTLSQFHVLINDSILHLKEQTCSICRSEFICNKVSAGIWLDHVGSVLEAKWSRNDQDSALIGYATHPKIVSELMQLLRVNVAGVPVSGGFILEMRQRHGSAPEIRVLIHEQLRRNSEGRRIEVAPSFPPCEGGTEDGWCPFDQFLLRISPNRIRNAQRVCTYPYPEAEKKEPATSAVRSDRTVDSKQASFKTSDKLISETYESEDDSLSDAAKAASVCQDPRRFYVSCGTVCPPGCGAMGKRKCLKHCVNACYCRAPYLLLDPYNLTSPCILPEDCPLEKTEAIVGPEIIDQRLFSLNTRGSAPNPAGVQFLPPNQASSHGNGPEPSEETFVGGVRPISSISSHQQRTPTPTEPKFSGAGRQAWTSRVSERTREPSEGAISVLSASPSFAIAGLKASESQQYLQRSPKTIQLPSILTENPEKELPQLARQLPGIKYFHFSGRSQREFGAEAKAEAAQASAVQGAIGGTPPNGNSFMGTEALLHPEMNGQVSLPYPGDRKEFGREDSATDQGRSALTPPADRTEESNGLEQVLKEFTDSFLPTLNKSNPSSEDSGTNSGLSLLSSNGRNSWTWTSSSSVSQSKSSQNPPVASKQNFWASSGTDSSADPEPEPEPEVSVGQQAAISAPNRPQNPHGNQTPLGHGLWTSASPPSSGSSRGTPDSKAEPETTHSDGHSTFNSSPSGNSDGIRVRLPNQSGNDVSWIDSINALLGSSVSSASSSASLFGGSESSGSGASLAQRSVQTRGSGPILTETLITSSGSAPEPSQPSFITSPLSAREVKSTDDTVLNTNEQEKFFENLITVLEQQGHTFSQDDAPKLAAFAVSYFRNFSVIAGDSNSASSGSAAAVNVGDPSSSLLWAPEISGTGVGTLSSDQNRPSETRSGSASSFYARQAKTLSERDIKSIASQQVAEAQAIAKQAVDANRRPSYPSNRHAASVTNRQTNQPTLHVPVTAQSINLVPSLKSSSSAQEIPTRTAQKFLCDDPLKQYRSCGPSCPQGCGTVPGSCNDGKCQPGCFCVIPLVLADPKDGYSKCVPRSQCPRKTLQLKTVTRPNTPVPASANLKATRRTSGRVASPKVLLPNDFTHVAISPPGTRPTALANPPPPRFNARRGQIQVSPPLRRTPPPIQPRPILPPVRSSDNCVDKTPRSCIVWAGRGFCQRYPTFMSLNCRKSCNACPPLIQLASPNCQDQNKSCTFWARRGDCGTNRRLMSVVCPKSCAFCAFG